MLVLTRKSGESFRIGNNIIVKVLDIKSGHIKIGIDAAHEIPIYREEVYIKIVEGNKASIISEQNLNLLKDIKHDADKE